MGTLNPENDLKEGFEDSGYVQEEAASAKMQCTSKVDLLDLSDDVLLYILQYLTPRDLKALGYTCSRLGALVLDRTLWLRVDARGQPCGQQRMRWLLAHALSHHTTALRLSGYAREALGCVGYVNNPNMTLKDNPPINRAANGEDVPSGRGRVYHLTGHSTRYGSRVSYWPDPPPDDPNGPAPTGHYCPGPQITLTPAALTRLSEVCVNLTELSLDYCVIDCFTTKITMFPRTIKKLSLRGTKCFNIEKSFLYKIQDRLVYLEDLDVCECEWIEPACMLPLSKMPRLARLLMADCHKLSEFVAYASLATRYGFKTLKVLDLRRCPVGDSEVSALGWVPRLEELYLEPAPTGPRPALHAHCTRDPCTDHTELDPWEEQEPEYYENKYAAEQWIHDDLNQSSRRNFTSVTDAIRPPTNLERLIAEPLASPLPPQERTSVTLEDFNNYLIRRDLSAPRTLRFNPALDYPHREPVNVPQRDEIPQRNDLPILPHRGPDFLPQIYDQPILPERNPPVFPQIDLDPQRNDHLFFPRVDPGASAHIYDQPILPQRVDNPQNIQRSNPSNQANFPQGNQDPQRNDHLFFPRVDFDPSAYIYNTAVLSQRINNPQNIQRSNQSNEANFPQGNQDPQRNDPVCFPRTEPTGSAHIYNPPILPQRVNNPEIIQTNQSSQGNFSQRDQDPQRNDQPIFLQRDQGTQRNDEPIFLQRDQGTQRNDEPIFLQRDQGTQRNDEPIFLQRDQSTQRNDQPILPQSDQEPQINQQLVPRADQNPQRSDRQILPLSSQGELLPSLGRTNMPQMKQLVQNEQANIQYLHERLRVLNQAFRRQLNEYDRVVQLNEVRIDTAESFSASFAALSNHLDQCRALNRPTGACVVTDNGRVRVFPTIAFDDDEPAGNNDGDNGGNAEDNGDDNKDGKENEGERNNNEDAKQDSEAGPSNRCSDAASSTESRAGNSGAGTSDIAAVSSNDEPGTSSSTPGSSNSGPGHSYSNGSSKHENCATKAARKYYDDQNCQVSRALLKDSLNDFKKRTEDSPGQIFRPANGNQSPNFADSDDDASNDDDDDDDEPQTKRARTAINNGASTSNTNGKNDENEPNTSPQQPNQTLTEPSPSSTEPSLSPTSKLNDDEAMSFNNEDSSQASNSRLADTKDGESAKSTSSTRPSPSSTQPSPSSTQPSPSSTQPSPSSTQQSSSSMQASSPSMQASSSSTPRRVTITHSRDAQHSYIRITQNEPPLMNEGRNNPWAPIYNNNINNEINVNNNDVQQRDWNEGLRRGPVAEIIPGPIIDPASPYMRPFGPSRNYARNRRNQENVVNADPIGPMMADNRVVYFNIDCRRRRPVHRVERQEPIDQIRRAHAPHGYRYYLHTANVAPRLEYTSLVTDAAIRRFGRADGENINYVQIGPMGPVPAPYDDPHARPDRSNLRILSVTGYRHITNFSLTHLATAAPHLQFVDFTGTRVTESGVQHFRNLRPECRVRYGTYDMPKEDSERPHSR